MDNKTKYEVQRITEEFLNKTHDIKIQESFGKDLSKKGKTENVKIKQYKRDTGMEDGLIIGFDLAKEESKSSCTLIVSRPIQKHAIQVINEFQGEKAKQIYMVLTGNKSLENEQNTKSIFDDIGIYNNMYENANKKVLEEFMQYTFFENGQKILVLDKEKIKQKYKVQNVIFEEEDVEHE